MVARLTRYGVREILLSTFATAGACALLGWLAWRVNWWFALAGVVPAAVWLWVLWFFRDPDRAVPAGDGLFISPADGNVADITQVGPESPLGRDGVKVGVFMNVFSVHVNRSPIAARVDRTEHAKGVFLDARDPHASEKNESATIYLTHERGGIEYPIVVRQIAGLVARRIITDLRQGQVLSAGEKIGMIKFGSRLELFVPRELAGRVQVEIGQRVWAGETVLVSIDQECSNE